MKKIAVLLSTYNGEKFLSVQLESLLAQKDIDLTIFVRDDGSSDTTPNVLAQFAAQHKNIHLRLEKNIGVIASFFDLMTTVDDDFDYYALADQDDYWLPEKLISAVNKLEQQSKDNPLLYCSALEFVDKDLVHLGMSNLNFKPSFGNALVENIVTGCTAVFNVSLKKLVSSYQPKQAVMHDWWLYLLATAFGQVIYDPVAYIKYRQHGANVVGATPNFMRLWHKRLFMVLQNKPILSVLQLEEFYTLFGEKLTNENRNLARKFIERKTSINSRWFIIYSALIYKQNSLDTIAMKLLIALGRY